MKKIIILRHGETDFNAKGIVQGRGIDSHLNETGQKQADSFYEYFKEISFDLILTSSLKRSQQTISKFISKQSENWLYSPLIDEISWGTSEGLANKHVIFEIYDQLIKSWGRSDFNIKVEQGETAWELAARLNIFIEWLKHQPYSNVLICTHGRTLRVLIALISNIHLSQMESIAHSNTGWYEIDYYQGKFNLIKENSTIHLEAND